MVVSVVMIATILTLFMFVTVGCSLDIEIEEKVEEIPPPPPPEPEPRWADGVITIKTGRFKTSEEIVLAIETTENVHADRGTRYEFSKPNSKLKIGKPREVKVTVVTLLEAGFTEPVTLKEIRKRYEELGFRPLTLEEVMELRLQFTDQPDIATGHKMSMFFVLLSEKEAQNCFLEDEETTFIMYRAGIRKGYGEEFGLFGHDFKSRIFDPYAREITGFGVQNKLNPREGTRFACVIMRDNN